MVIHRAACGLAVERLEALGKVRATMSPTHAGDVLSFLSLPATWRTLGGKYGWAFDEVEAWIVDTAMALVTDSARSPR